MGKELSELVHIVGEESPQFARVQQAIKWVASTPEGIAILNDAYALHEKPLVINLNSNLPENGYGAFGEHQIDINPKIDENITYHGQQREIIPFSLERFFAHEFKHAAQPGILNNDEYKTTLMLINAEALFEQMPLQEYLYRIKATGNKPPKLKVLMGEMYDKYILNKAELIEKNINERLAQSDIVQEYIQKFEVPAIEFENVIMHYKYEPARITDYLNSVVDTHTDNEMSRAHFIESSIESIKAQNLIRQLKNIDISQLSF